MSLESLVVMGTIEPTEPEGGRVPEDKIDLHYLDREKLRLENEHPGWRIWYVPTAGRGTAWCAQPLPNLSEYSTDDLSRAIREAEAEMLLLGGTPSA